MGQWSMKTNQRIFAGVSGYILLIVQRLFWLEWKSAVDQDRGAD